jgi:hypothetical protein
VKNICESGRWVGGLKQLGQSGCGENSNELACCVEQCFSTAGPRPGTGS